MINQADRKAAMQLGYTSYSTMELKAPMANPAVEVMLSGVAAGTSATEVYRAYTLGWDEAAQEAADGVLEDIKS